MRGRWIRSLEAYPLQYLETAPVQILSEQNDPGADHSGTEPQQEDMLLERGRKFIDVTAVSHMSYEGLTIGTNREEVG